MIVASLVMDLQVYGCQSLKDKRHVVRGLRERIRSKFNVSVAEVDCQDLWQRAVLGVAVVAADGRFAREVLDKVRHLVEQDARVGILSATVDFV